MSTIYSIEAPDDTRRYYANRAEALDMAQSQSHALQETFVVRSHVLDDQSLRALAVSLLNGGGLKPDRDVIIGWFSKGRRRRPLEDRP